MAKDISGTVYILKHVANEGAGTLLEYMKRRGIAHKSVALYENEALPSDWASIRAVLIMGGPMNVYDEDKHPFLKPENIFIQELLSRGIPCLGICLGSQLIAKALGKKVYKAPTKEVGWGDIQFLPEARKDALFSEVAAPGLRVLQWHEDTFDVPDGAELLASSKDVPHQAYRYKKTVYGFQFHVEVDEGILKDWFKDSADLLSILSEYGSYRKKLEEITDRLYSQFFSLETK